MRQYTVTLITGDVLFLTRQGDGPWAVAVQAAPRPYGAVPFQTFVDKSQGTFVVPADVIPLVPGLLDPYFFNIDYLVANRLHDEEMAEIGAIVDFSDSTVPATPWDSSVVASSPLPLINGEAISIPKDRVVDFGKVLWGHDAGWSPAGVDKIWLDRVFRVDLDQSVPLIGGDVARKTLGFDGKGVKIAILDTGIDATHPDFFFPDKTSKILVNLDMTCSVEPIIDVFCDKTPDDLFGHGTHVASIAAGTGAASSGKFTGVAPGASLMNVKVLNRFGFGFFSWVIKGMEVAAVDQKADVISMSLGGGPTDGTDPASRAVDRLVRDFGVTMVIAAGNGFNNFAVATPGAATQAITVAASTKVGSPIISETSPTARSFAGNLMDQSVPIPSAGIKTQVVSVANFGGDPSDFPADTKGHIALIARGGGIFFRVKALNAAAAGAVAALIYNDRPGNFQGTLINPDVPIPVVSMSQEDGLALKADVVAGATTVNLFSGPPAIASFSSKGPRVDNFDIKPDITGPGVGIIAACASKGGAIPCPTGEKYVTLSGTSMATPHVSGSVALVMQQAKQAGRILTPAQVKDIVLGTSQVLQPAVPGMPDVDIYAQGAGLVRPDRALTSQVALSPAEISFGVVTFDTKTLERTFEVTNRGPSSRSITLSLELRDVQTRLSPLSTGASLSGIASLSATNLFLAGGGKASVKLTVDVSKAPTQKLWSIFSGRIFIRDTSGELAHAIFGFTKEGRRQVLSLAGSLPDGRPAAFGSFSFFDAEDSLGLLSFFESLDATGHRTMRLPLSSYNFLMQLVVFQVISFDPFVFSLKLFRVAAMEVRVVENPASVSLDASKTGEVKLDIQADPKATRGLQQDDFFVYVRRDGSSVGTLFSILGGNWDVFAVNTAEARLGTLWIHDRWVRVRDPAATSKNLFDLTLTRNQQAPVVKVVSKDDLEETTGEAVARIHVDNTASFFNQPGVKAFGRFSFPARFFFPFAITSFYPVQGAIVRHEFQTATEAVFRQFIVPGRNIFWFDTPFETKYFGFNLMGKIWAPGEELVERWMEQPVHPTLTSAVRSGNSVSFTGHEIVDSFGHFGLFVPFNGASFSLEVFVNNVRALGPSPFFPFVARVTVPATPATVEVRMTMSADSAWSVLARNTVTSITFTTSPSVQGDLSLPLSNYRIRGLNLLNQVPADDERTSIKFAINLATPAGRGIVVGAASVQISVNDGATWFPAMKVDVEEEGLEVRASVPTSGAGPFFVSVRVSVETVDGAVLNQVIIRAIQLVPEVNGGS